MDVQRYRDRRAQFLSEEPLFRNLCHTCIQPDFSCYCAWLQPIDPKIQFVILTHPIEVRRRIATGRMSFLSLKDAKLISGHDYTHNAELNRILHDPSLQCVMLYPGRFSTNLSEMSLSQRQAIVPQNKKLCVLVIDGTWATAKKMVNLSQNLKSLPRVCFTPLTPSNFRVRQQPRPECYSTIEAIHHTIELMGDACEFDVQSRAHDCLLSVFDQMVNRQIELAHCGKPSRKIRG